MPIANAIKWAILFLLFASPTLIFSQKKIITVDFQNEKINNALIQIAAENGYEISFNSSYFEDKKISLSENNQPINSVLEKLLEGTNVEISIRGNKIILKKYRKVFGQIIDERSGETLISATVFSPKSNKGVLSNTNGYFSIRVPFENQDFIFSYVGYELKNQKIPSDAKFPIRIKMKSNSRLSEIIVEKDEQLEAIEKELGKLNLLSNEIKTLFATGGEPDVFQYLYAQPGISTGPDGLGGVHVRGGDVGQNLFLMDGVKVYTPFHSLGLFSVFDVNQLKHANFSKFGFHPKHGGRLSSVLDMTLKEGNLQNWNTDLSVSTLATHVGVNGPLAKDKASISIYARRTHLDPVVKNVSENRKFENLEEGYSNHFFYDVNAKLLFQPNPKDRFSLTVYNGRDVYKDKTDFFYEDEFLTITDSIRYNVKWENQLAALKWNHLFNEKFTSNFTISYTENKYQSYFASKYYDFEIGYDEFEQSSIFQFFSNIKDLGAELNFDFFPNENHHVSFGIGHHRINYRPGVGRDSLDSSLGGVSDDPFEDYFDDLLDNAYVSNETHFFIHDKWRLGKKLTLNFGGRVSQFSAKNLLFLEDSNHQTYQVNASLRWLVLKNLSTTFSFDRTAQTVHLLSTSNIGFPNDFWLPSIENIRPSVANQFNWGLTWDAHSNFRITSNVYYKKMENLYRFSELSSIPSLFDFSSNWWEAQLTSGEGISKGVELKADYQQSNFKTSVAYTLSESDRRFENFNNDERFPFEFDQRHKLTIQFFQKIKNDWWWYANWNFYNGLQQTLYLSDGPFTPLDNYFPPPDIRLTSVNGDQLADYHRLDIGIVWRKDKGRFAQEFNLGVQNVYNRKNVFFSYQEEDPFFPEFNGLKKSKAFPLLPFFMYKIKVGKN